jgi:hypothetical protein
MGLDVGSFLKVPWRHIQNNINIFGSHQILAVIFSGVISAARPESVAVELIWGYVQERISRVPSMH